MSEDYRQGLLASEESKNISHTPPNSVISNSDSLEDGEISEGHLSGSTAGSQPLSDDQPQLHSSNVRPSVPPSLPAESGHGLAPLVEPMTKEDLDRAKSLMLDLLGWGVTPEYLVECGLSPRVVHKIFTDLRLRLPRNIGTPFTPAPRGAP